VVSIAQKTQLAKSRQDCLYCLTIYFGYETFLYMSKLPLTKILHEFGELNNKLSSNISQQEMIELGKLQKSLSQKANFAELIQKLEKTIEDNQELINSNQSDEMVEMLTEETNESKQLIEKYTKDLLTLLAPSDDRDGMNIYLEIRAGAGGDESAIFASDLLKMYSILCVNLNLKMKILSLSENTVGGYKEVIAEIKGENAFSWFKSEGGVHRVQRVPATEKQGRIHTSTASVAIMPVIDQNSTFKLDLSEVDIVASTSQGAGGQSVNTTYSAIQALHRPTGIRAQCQDERNQQQNKIKALEILSSRVFNHYEEERLAKEYAERKDQVGTADRSEKIRTYNYPQDRITDHRYNISFNNLPSIMTGGIIDIINQIKQIEGERAIDNLSVV
jgi:peptide chain release factor 1